MATMLRLEKYGKVDFTLGKLTKRHPKTAKSRRTYTKGHWELVEFFFSFTIEGVGVIFLQVVCSLY